MSCTQSTGIFAGVPAATLQTWLTDALQAQALRDLAAILEGT